MTSDNVTQDTLLGENSFQIPNTMYMAWFGEMGVLGQGWMMWETNKADLQKLGFHVETFNNDNYHPNAPKTAKAVFTTYLATLSERKQLHGLYMMGHGGKNQTVGSLGTRCYTKGPEWNISYGAPEYDDQKNEIPPGDGSDSIRGQIKYHLGALIIHACYSDNNYARSLISNNGGIFKGTTGVYVPIRGVNTEPISMYWGAERKTVYGDIEVIEIGGKQRTSIFAGDYKTYVDYID